jgi:hypothetical protein
VIKTREQLRAEADADVAEFSELLASSQSDTSGIPPPPRIDVTETNLDPEPFEFPQLAEPENAVGACCSEDGCGVTLQSGCPGIWLGPGTNCEDNPCGGGAVCCPPRGIIFTNIHVVVTGSFDCVALGFPFSFTENVSDNAPMIAGEGGIDCTYVQNLGTPTSAVSPLFVCPSGAQVTGNGDWLFQLIYHCNTPGWAFAFNVRYGSSNLTSWSTTGVTFPANEFDGGLPHTISGITLIGAPPGSSNFTLSATFS